MIPEEKSNPLTILFPTPMFGCVTPGTAVINIFAFGGGGSRQKEPLRARKPATGIAWCQRTMVKRKEATWKLELQSRQFFSFIVT